MDVTDGRRGPGEAIRKAKKPQRPGGNQGGILGAGCCAQRSGRDCQEISKPKAKSLRRHDAGHAVEPAPVEML